MSEPATQNRRAILITGASTGIGKASTLRMIERGCQVFAGVRKQADAETLRAEAGEHCHPVIIDVTQAETIASARDEVQAAVSETGLQGLVNNAGIVVGGALEIVPIEELRKQFEVNVIGQIAVTQAFLPLLRQGKGRIVMMSSIAGRSAMPFTSPYCSSKFALEALSDSLRIELTPWGIPVSLIEPGAIQTPIWDKAQSDAQAIQSHMSEEGKQLYGDILERFYEKVQQVAAGAAPVSKVADAVEKALTASRPKARYPVGRDARMRFILEAMPTRWRDGLLRKLVGVKQS